MKNEGDTLFRVDMLVTKVTIEAFGIEHPIKLRHLPGMVGMMPVFETRFQAELAIAGFRYPPTITEIKTAGLCRSEAKP